MTTDTGPATASGVASDVYEFRIAGTIGPVVRSALDAHGSPAVHVRLTGDTAAAALPRSDSGDRDETLPPTAADLTGDLATPE